MAARTLAERLSEADEERFVGRRRELEVFDRLLVEEPPANIVLVHGPGGMGKSTLLREVARRGRERGFAPIFVDGRALDPVPGEIERALSGVEELWRPLILLDTFERIEALGGWLRERLLPALPARALAARGRRRRPRRPPRARPRLDAGRLGVARRRDAAGPARRGGRARAHPRARR